ncbi:hypothetical protein PPACK8108_LOCUS19212 [Phakopsora pachyrhizi]|uniref:J domain-containing protein n=1 Tax=Phakopsora pachyrhizi TaxID=170000 RepID=A0AAV0BEE9_PHAPC|nr:hypothetical protein PPACK8108_LOCUS19212 [Phakopsora pachyrhizi]
MPFHYLSPSIRIQSIRASLTPSASRQTNFNSFSNLPRFYSKNSESGKDSDKSYSSIKFPTNPYPTPYQIFNLHQSASTDQIKSRYYQLVKLYHPDISNSTLKEKDDTKFTETSRGIDNDEIEKKFKLIVDAYELLKSPSRREAYKRFGTGWIHNDPRFKTLSINRYTTDLNRAKSSASSSYYDSYLRQQSKRRDGFSFDDEWSRNGRSSQSKIDRGYYSFKEQWQRQGLMMRNGYFISSIGLLGLVVWITQFWGILIPREDKIQGNRSLIYSSGRGEEDTKFKRFLEPKGDQRLDLEAWRSVEYDQRSQQSPSSITTFKGMDSPSAITSSTRSSLSSSSSYIKRLERQNQKSVNDLKRARGSALPPSKFIHRFSSSFESNKDHENDK